MAAIWTFIADSVIAANKAILATTGIQLRNNTEYLKQRLDNTPPVGSSIGWTGAAASVPAGWLLCDGSEVSNTTYELLFGVYIADGITIWGRGTKVGDFTVDTVTDEIVLAAHGQAVDNVVYLSNTGGGLPAGLSADTKYYVVAINGADRLQVSAAKGGVPVDITGAGTGTHHLYDKFKVPDARGKSALGVNDASLPNGADGTFTTRNEGATGGEEAHTPTISETAAHTHTAGTSGAGSSGPGTTAPVGEGPTGSTGGGNPFNVMHPFWVRNEIVYTGAV